MISNLLFYGEGAIVFLVILVVLVGAHEYGHYLFARLFNMGVEEFSIGMFGAKPLVTWRRKTYRLPVRPGEDPYKTSSVSGFNMESAGPAKPVHVVDTPSGQMIEETTDFTVRPWPIGGFVRIKGMMPEEDGSETKIVGGFYSKPPIQRLIVLLAGPAFSVLSGILVMIPVFMTVGDVRPSNEPKIVSMLQEGVAYKAGMRPGDTVLEVNGAPIHSFLELVEMTRSSDGKPLAITFSDKNVTRTVTVTPTLSEEPTPVLGSDLTPTGEMKRQWLLGLVAKGALKRLSLADATMAAIDVPIKTVVNLLGAIKAPSTAKDSLGGPGTMLSVTSEAVQTGFSSVVEVAAIISISVGILNLLPIPPLDGGQMVVAFAEMLRGGRRLSMRVQGTVSTVGLGLVVLLIVTAFAADFQRFEGPKKPPPKIVSQEKTDKPDKPAK